MIHIPIKENQAASYIRDNLVHSNNLFSLMIISFLVNTISIISFFIQSFTLQSIYHRVNMFISSLLKRLITSILKGRDFMWRIKCVTLWYMSKSISDIIAQEAIRTKRNNILKKNCIKHLIIWKPCIMSS
jgi:hypothetical protein